MIEPPFLAPDAATSTVRWRAALGLGLAIAALHALWVLGLPFQLDDYFVLENPWIGFQPELLGHRDLEPFMCRIPMWVLWGLVTPLAGEPTSPVAFHVVGLALHALVVALVARCLGRCASGRIAILGALATGLAAGALQAVTWTAAWSSLTYTLFAFGALELAFEARRLPGSLWRRVAAAGCIALALLSKAPAIVVPAVVVLVLLGTTRKRRTWLADLATLGSGFLIGWGVRQLFLGASELGYFEQDTPGALQVLARIPNGLDGLAQALVPWNRDPLVAGLAPWTARVTGGLVPAWGLAAIAFGLPALAGLALRTKRQSAVLLAALGPAILPLAMLYLHTETNVASRSAYLPLPFAFGAWALGVGALLEWRRGAGYCALVLGLFVLVDGSVHVIRTERAAGAHIRKTQEHVEALLTEEPEALVLTLVDDGGYAGIPALGGHVAYAARPPFVAAPGLEIAARRNEAELLRVWRRASIEGDRPLAYLRALTDEPAVRSAVMPTAGTARSAARHVEGNEWKLDSPRPRHACCALEIERDPTVTCRARITLVGPDGPLEEAIDLALPSGGPERVSIELGCELDALFGPPVSGLVVELQAASVIRSLAIASKAASTPGLELDLQQPISVIRERAPRLEHSFDDTRYPSGAFARLALTFVDSSGLRHELCVDGDGTGFSLDSLHQSPFAARGAPGLSWAGLVDQHLHRLLRDRRYRWLSFEAEVTVHTSDGTHVLARSPLAEGRLIDERPEAGE